VAGVCSGAPRVRRRGVALRITTNEPVKLSLSTRLSKRDAAALASGALASAVVSVNLGATGSRALKLRLNARARRTLLRSRRAQAAGCRACRRDRPRRQSLRRSRAVTVKR
jgi:hypothetical protein